MKVGIIGASGYTGAELVRILSRHPEVDLAVVTSRQYAGKPLSDIFPHLRGISELNCENPAIEDLLQMADLFFTAVPHQTAMDIVPKLLDAGKKVVDLSADFRIRSAAVYEKWYQTHTASYLLDEAVYGLPELYREDIKGARIVANPGCYPTSAILALAPLLRQSAIDASTIIIDSKSGTSGAGRGAAVGTLFCEVADGFRAYKIGEHRHTPEIEQELSILAGQNVTVSFTPHLVPMARGILSTIYAQLNKPIEPEDVAEMYREAYRNESFIRLCKAGVYPATQYVRGANFCDIGFKVDTRTGRIVIVAVIDNLVKGAAGQAVQNMNIMSGFAETEGLLGVPVFP
jgi:N-acetyl-gamma-glutamyl-phosphate reductase